MPQQLLTDRYAPKIRGVLSCFDRILLTGTLPDICFPEGMTKHLASKGIRVFDYAEWARPFNEEIRANAENLAQETGLTIEYVSKPRSFRHRRLREFVRRFCPVARHFRSEYYWSFMQVEYALDVVFDRQSDLAPIYENLIRTAVHAVKAADIATFLARKLTDRTSDEVGNNFETRIEGSRIRHHMGWAAIKMYDKFALILRIETVCNDVSYFRHYRRVERQNGSSETKLAPMKRSVYSLAPLREVMAAANRRYLEFLSSLDDPSSGVASLDRISQPTHQGARSYRGFNLLTQTDQQIFEVILQGHFNFSGFRNRTLRQGLPDLSPSQVSRLLTRLRLHGLVKKVARQSKYYLTRLGRAVGIAALGLRAFFLLPQLARPLAARR